jgi:hypothetical protein
MNKLKTSYEMLVKYSFLAQDDDQLVNEVKHESKNKLQNIYFSTKTSNYANNKVPKDANNTI